MLKHADKLIRKLQFACRGKELMVVFAALESVMEGVLEQVRDDQLRNDLTIRLIYMLLSLPALVGIKRWDSQQGLAAIAAMPDGNERNGTALGRIKTLASISTSLSTDAHDAARLELLHRHYAAIDDDAAELISRLYEHAAGAAGLIQCLTKGDLQVRASLMYIHAVIAMPEFSAVETIKLKQILRSVADIPDEEFRESAALGHIDRSLSAHSQQSARSG